MLNLYSNNYKCNSQDKRQILESHGFRFVGEPDSKNRIRCHSPFREDKKPSCRVWLDSGFFKDYGTGEALRFWELMERLGYRDYPHYSKKPKSGSRSRTSTKPTLKPVKQSIRDFFRSVSSASFKSSEADSARRYLASDFRVSVNTLERIGIGCRCEPALGFGYKLADCWVYPEYDGFLDVVGCGTRAADHSWKMCIAGSTRGLILDPNMQVGPVLVIAEGMSDTATLLGMGLCAIGRPMLNSPNADTFLADYIKQNVPKGTQIFYLVDSDDQDKKKLALKSASELVNLCKRSIHFAEFLDSSIKDAREYHERFPDAGEQEFLSALNTIELQRFQSLNPDGTHRDCCECELCELETLKRIWAEQEASKRDCFFHRTVCHATNHHIKPATHRVHCDTWQCPTCRKNILIPKWKNHLDSIIDREDCLYAAWVTQEQLASILKTRSSQSRRDKSKRFEFARVHTRDGRIYFVANGAFEGGEKTNPEQIKSGLRMQFNSLEIIGVERVKSKKKVVSTSKNWQLPKEPKSRNGGGN